MRLLSFFAASTLMAASSTSLLAQSRPSLEIVIGKLSDTAARCGINESTLRTPATLTLRNNRISVSKLGTDPYLYIIITVLYSAEIEACTFGILTGVRTSQSPRQRDFLKASGSETIFLCIQSRTGFSPRSAFSKMVSDEVSQAVSDCLVNLEY